MERLFLSLGLSLFIALAAACDDKPAETPKTGPEKGAKASPEAKKPAEDKKATEKKPAEKTADKGTDKGAPTDDKPVAKPDGEGGQLVESELYSVKFTVPEGWKVSKGPTGISANSADNGIQLIVAGSKSQDVLEAALRDLKSNVTFKDVKIQKQGATVINGLAGIRGEGDATIVDGDKESPTHFVAFLSKVDDKSVTALIVTSQERYTKDLDLIESVLGTLSKK